jgi:HSP20 family protein
MAEKQQDVHVDKPSAERPKAPVERPQRGLSALAQIERDMQRMFDSFFGARWRPSQWELPELPFGETSPRVDVIDRENEVLVRVELPGVEKKDIDVSLGDDTVTIRATAHKEAREERGDYFRREISKGEFSRTIALPCDVDPAKAQAKFENGVLQLTLAKPERARRKQISID